MTLWWRMTGLVQLVEVLTEDVLSLSNTAHCRHNQHPTIPLQQHAIWLLRWLTRPLDDIPDVVEVVARHTRCMQVVGGEVLGGSATNLQELVVIATEFYAGDQHTHANPPEQLLVGNLLLSLWGQPFVCQLQHGSSCSGGNM